MSDFKDRMIEAVGRGWTDEAHAYEHVRESYADAADMERKRRKEEAPEERIVAIREDGSARVEPDEEPPDWRERIFRCSDVDESGGVR